MNLDCPGERARSRERAPEVMFYNFQGHVVKGLRLPPHSPSAWAQGPPGHVRRQLPRPPCWEEAQDMEREPSCEAVLGHLDSRPRRQPARCWTHVCRLPPGTPLHDHRGAASPRPAPHCCPRHAGAQRSQSCGGLLTHITSEPTSVAV